MFDANVMDPPAGDADPGRCPGDPALEDLTLAWTRCLVDGMAASARVMAMAEAMLITQVVELARVRRAEAAHDAQTDRTAGRRVVLDAEQVERVIADEVAVALRWSPRTASTRITAMETLLDRAPVTFAALAGGRLDAARAYRIAEGLTVLSAADAARIEPGLVAAAAQQTPAQVATAVRRAVIAADPAAADRAYARAQGRRRARVQAEDDGMASIWVTGSAHHISVAWQTIIVVATHHVDANTAARTAARQAGRIPPDLLTLDQARADAALALLRSPDGLPDSDDDLPEVVTHLHVVVPATEPSDPCMPPADLGGHGPIPPGLLTDLLGTGPGAGTWDHVRFTRWLSDTSGVVMHADSTSYRPSPTLAATIRARDMTCRFPGCRTAATHCDIDHTVPYPHGPTRASNLASLCRRHHRLKTHTRWRLRHLPGAVLEWTTPTGHVYVTRPPTWAPYGQPPAPPPGSDDPAPF